MTTADPKLTISSDGPIVMVDDSYDDFEIASLMYSRSELDNDFVHCDSAEVLFDYLDGARTGVGPFPSLILMDLNMPGMNGIEATRKLRDHPDYSAIPIISMLTSSVDPRDKSRAQSACANTYMVKPTNPMSYVEMFNSFLPADRHSL